ncbi:hypothetical protein [Altibacter sp. HG106]|uniref:hypothetical protein n=1 Tax=Altibacter sp. HG106 TaxID=3023937 RepID=UPI0023510117|nr:hypothetical protein [Altibacter sp. HG106]MDC7994469.1 hypothetical protein [Altibacter sp. HG106]
MLEGLQVFPFGSSDDLPREIKDVVQNNYIAPGYLKKGTGMLWGNGPKLYREEYQEDGQVKRIWVRDADIQQWMDDWDALAYIYAACVDYQYIQAVATKVFRNRGPRIGADGFITKLEHINPNRARKARYMTSRSLKATHCVYKYNESEKAVHNKMFGIYPLFDHRNAFKYPTSVHYSNLYSFCSDYYAVPDIYGALEWIRRSTAVPMILKAFTKNSITPKYHIQSPAMFWEEKEKELQKLYASKNKTYTDNVLKEFMQGYLKKVEKVLSGVDNTGKFWHSIKYLNVDGVNLKEMGWEIKPLDQKVKDFIGAQVKVGEAANRAVGAAVGMHPALGGSGESGRSDSGSEQIYAFKNYLASGIDIEEMAVLKTINMAIKVNWPNKDLKLGFYRQQPQKEQDITPSKRAVNN